MLLELNPFHTSLRLHSLSGRSDGAYSVSINMSYRIVLDIVFVDDNIVLLHIGPTTKFIDLTAPCAT